MTVIEVSFLTGRYSATAYHDRQASEWPPHGARLFSAMVAAWADGESPGEADGERAALEWLEAQPAPAIAAPEAVPRRVTSFFVPVNDARVVGGKRAVESALALLPVGRTKKERFFPSRTVVADAKHTPVVAYAWDENPSAELIAALDRLLARVTRLGHSSSLVSCRLAEDAPPATHRPVTEQEREADDENVRWVSRGQLRDLEDRHSRHEGIGHRPLPSREIAYRVGSGKAPAMSRLEPVPAAEWIVFELEPPDRRAPMTRTVELAQVLREAILSHVPDPLPEGVSGHLPAGRPTTQPHISFLALPNVGHEHADGRIMGLAVCLPPNLDGEARRATLRGIGKWEHKWEQENPGQPLELRMGRRGLLRMKRLQGPATLVSLRRSKWARSSRRWVSATPVALPNHPGVLHKGSSASRAKAWARAEEAVATSCEHVGLLRPVDVQVSFGPSLVGARPAGDYPAFRQGRGDGGPTARRLLHACVEFSQEVQGPLVLGSGRFLGLGLMRPVDAAVQHGEVVSKASDSESGHAEQLASEDTRDG